MPLRQLYPVPGNAAGDTTTVDIIAVHGLNPRSKADDKHAWDTWRTPPRPGGRIWLRDDLPHQFPDARIFLYQYNSTAVYGKDKSTFVDKANAFLESIRLKRRGHEKRPLLLLGHSLGGLLIKQALINAFNNEKYSQVRLATKGLAFFATPHDGGNERFVGIGSVAARIAIGLGFQKGDNILETLDNGSLFADLMHEQWKQRLLDFDIVSFWGTKDQIVPRESARFGLPGNRENVVALEADHSGVCKFGDGETDQDNLECVLGNIHDLVENALKISSRPDTVPTTTVQKLLRELYATPYKDHKDRNPDRVPGTCEWFISHDRFKRWQEQNTSSFLWVSADPGCGKSVLAKYLIDEVLPSTSTSTTCYFFFKDGFEGQRTVENALRCILRQLFDQRRDLLSNTLLEKFGSDGIATFNSFSDLWYMLTSIAHQENAGKIICLLDALDECEENGRFRLAQALNKLYKIESSGSVLKFLITSRPYASIQREFQTLENERPTIHLQGENQTEVDKISQEINVVIKHKVEALSSELTLQSYEKTRLHLRLTSIPHRTYLWVYLTFEALRAYNGFNLEDMTHHLPQTVDEAYESILKKSYNAKQARKLLHIVLSASRPLTLHEMFLALGRRHDAVLHGDIQIELTGRFRRKVRDLCGLFVIIVDSKVYLLHQTAREFLLRKQLGDHKLQWGGSFRLQESNHILATICVKYLHTVINDLSNDENQAFLDYSTQNWASHFRDASDQVDGALQQLSLQLCDPTSRLCIAWVKRFQATTAAAFPEEPTALILASYFGLYKLAARVLPRDMENLGVSDTKYSRTALTWAIHNGHERVVQLILEKASRTKEIIGRILLWNCSFVDLKDKDGRTALIHAAIHGHCDISKILIKKGARVTTRDKYGQTPISLATHYGHKKTIELLRNHGAILESQDKYAELTDRDGYTPLSRAIVHGHDDIIQMLLDMNAGIEALSRDGSSPLSNAASTGNTEVVQWLLDRNVNIGTASSHVPLIAAAYFGRIDTVRLLLERGADIEASNNNGRTALYVAAHFGHIGIVRLLLERGADIEASDNNGRRALHTVAQSGHIDTVRLLLERGANIEASDNNGRTALYVAVWNGHIDTARLLLERGADVEAKTKIGDTPATLVAWKNYKEIERMFR